ncbi:MAG TPA: thiolase family protein [Syntrophomonadaceae bacterium]|nr:thiolase family protein [Syntrophomonadaceae bacterium]
MRKVVITGAARTAVGSYYGGLKSVPAEQLFSHVMRVAMERSGNLDPLAVESVVCGQVESSMLCNNPGRWCAIDVGCDNAHGMTINRICGSSYQAMASAWSEIQTGHVDIAIAGGTESLSQAPYYLPPEFRTEAGLSNRKKVFDPNEEAHMNSGPPRLGPPEWMGVTADRVAKMYNISREDCDRFAYETQMKNKAANEAGKFVKEIAPIEVTYKRKTFVVDKDEFGKPNTTLESLAKLKASFTKDGVTTAGNATGFNDGAAALVMMTEEEAIKRGLPIMAYMTDYAIGVCDPLIMGVAPAYGIPKLLKRTSLEIKDIDLFEINEAFAAQCLGIMRILDVYPFDDGPNKDAFYPKLNPLGNGLSIGHPLGATGARIATTALYEMIDNNYKKSICSACIGGGMAVTILFERP